MPSLSITDLHSHLVPGVDDGARTVDEAIAALGVLAAEGVTRVITTPHLLIPRLATDWEIAQGLDEHRRAFDRLVAAIPARSELPRIGLGQEIWAPDAESARRALRQPSIGLGGTRFLLVEFGFDLEGRHDDVIEAVLAAGRRIVVAHPERYRFPAGLDPLDTIRRWRDLGAVLQVNAGSLTRHYGAGAETLAWQMIESGLAGLIATDHHAGRRVGVSPAEARAALEARGASAEARLLLADNPERIARGLDPLAVPPLGAGAARES